MHQSSTKRHKVQQAGRNRLYYKPLKTSAFRLMPRWVWGNSVVPAFLLPIQWLRMDRLRFRLAKPTVFATAETFGSVCAAFSDSSQHFGPLGFTARVHRCSAYPSGAPSAVLAVSSCCNCYCSCFVDPLWVSIIRSFWASFSQTEVAGPLALAVSAKSRASTTSRTRPVKMC